jgi:hypothetical protein
MEKKIKTENPAVYAIARTKRTIDKNNNEYWEGKATFYSNGHKTFSESSCITRISEIDAMKDAEGIANRVFDTSRTVNKKLREGA